MIRTNVAAGRRLARQMMLDRCVTTRRSGPPVLDPETGSLSPQAVDVYAGPCRVRAPELDELRRTFGEAVATVAKFIVIVPWDAPAHRVGDVVQVTETGDPTLGAVALRVVAVPVSTFVMYRALATEVVQ